MATIFSKVISGEFEGSFVYKDDLCVAFMDLTPLCEGHLLVVPIEEKDRVADLAPKTAGRIMEVAQKIIRALEKSDIPTEGTNLFINDGVEAGQEVPHVHLHIVPRYSGDEIGSVFRGKGDMWDRSKLDTVAAKIRVHL